MRDWLIFFGGTALVSIGTFWLGVWIYHAFDRRKMFADRKIQANRYPSEKLIGKARKLIFKNQLLIQVPLLFFTYPTFAFLGMNFDLGQLPVLWVIPLQILFFMFIEDFLFYWAHRTFHHPRIYKKIHKIHHEFVVSSAIAALYAHPIEFVIANLIPSIVGPMLLLLAGFPVHLWTLWIWLFMRILETLDGHSGYEFRLWFPHKLIYGGGARPHDEHHSKFNGNFASFFHHWDKIHGTTLEVKKPNKSLSVAYGKSKTHTTG